LTVIGGMGQEVGCWGCAAGIRISGWDVTPAEMRKWAARDELWGCDARVGMRRCGHPSGSTRYYVVLPAGIWASSRSVMDQNGVVSDGRKNQRTSGSSIPQPPPRPPGSVMSLAVELSAGK